MFAYPVGWHRPTRVSYLSIRRTKPSHPDLGLDTLFADLASKLSDRQTRWKWAPLLGLHRFLSAFLDKCKYESGCCLFDCFTSPAFHFLKKKTLAYFETLSLEQVSIHSLPFWPLHSTHLLFCLLCLILLILCCWTPVLVPFQHKRSSPCFRFLVCFLRVFSCF